MSSVRAARSRRWRDLPGGLLAAVAWTVVVAGIAPAQEPRPAERPAAHADASKLADEYVEKFVQRERLQAGNAFLERESERLEQTSQPGSPAQSLLNELEGVDVETGGALAQMLQDNAEPVVQDLNDTSAELNQQVEELKETWKSVRTSLNQGHFLLFEVKGGRRVAGQFASLLSVDKRWFWLFGLIAIVTLVAVVFHDRRHELRRLLNGGRARAMRLSNFLSAAAVVLAILTLATFLMGDRIYEALLTLGSGEETSPRRSIAAQDATIQSEIEALQQTREALEAEHEQVRDAWRRKLTDVLPARNRIPLRWKQSRTWLLEIHEALAVLDRLPQAVEADRAELEKLNEELNAQAVATASYLRLRRWIRGGLGLALVGLAAVGGFLFRRGVRQRRQITTNTCPLCLGRNHLEPVPHYGHQGDGVRELEVVRCKNVIGEEPYEECDYNFMDVYRQMTKVCFPTLGVPQAGKTHWLAMLYWELNRGNYPRSIQFEKIKSQSSEDFDLIVEEILNSRIGTAATQGDRIPRPLVFNFQDRDRWGRSNVLVNIFDYSGEVTADMGVEDYRRRRALDGDGFFFFLDPTYPSEPQAKALADFREDIRLVKGVKTGKQIRTPVAICVSKIDVLAGQSYALPDGGDAIARFYEDLSEIDPTGEAMALDVLEARSQLMARLRDTIWPGWQIERQIHDLFGGRYLFFPLTPVGLDGCGETDLSLRTISPFGLLEPLLWLLQMNGYPILE